MKKKDEKCDLYPLEVNYCGKCHNCQLSVSVDPKKMFSNYLYTSSTSKVFRGHFINAAQKYIKDLNQEKKIHKLAIDYYNLLEGIWSENCTISPNSFFSTFKKNISNTSNV